MLGNEAVDYQRARQMPVDSDISAAAGSDYKLPTRVRFKQLCLVFGLVLSTARWDQQWDGWAASAGCPRFRKLNTEGMGSS